MRSPKVMRAGTGNKKFILYGLAFVPIYQCFSLFRIVENKKFEINEIYNKQSLKKINADKLLVIQARSAAQMVCKKQEVAICHL